jgi:hypothetical protein
MTSQARATRRLRTVAFRRCLDIGPPLESLADVDDTECSRSRSQAHAAFNNNNGPGDTAPSRSDRKGERRRLPRNRPSGGWCCVSISAQACRAAEWAPISIVSDMPTVDVPMADVKDWDTFHDTFAKTLPQRDAVRSCDQASPVPTVVRWWLHHRTSRTFSSQGRTSPADAVSLEVCDVFRNEPGYTNTTLSRRRARSWGQRQHVSRSQPTLSRGQSAPLLLAQALHKRAAARTWLPLRTSSDSGAFARVEHNRSRRAKGEPPGSGGRPSSAWSCICIVTSACARSDTTS